MVTTAIYRLASTRILYDADALTPDVPAFLHPDYWRQRKGLEASYVGRGEAVRVVTDAGPAVLRRFRRGGWIGRFNRDRYLFTGWDNSRAFREFELLARLQEMNLPVPRPLAASCERVGAFYRAGLMTAWIPDSMPLADVISDKAADTPPWREIGRVLRRFHDHGVEHADLNARNILLDAAGGIHLIDLDRGRLIDLGIRARRAMLARLRRSLKKFAPHEEVAALWPKLLSGYTETRP